MQRAERGSGGPDGCPLSKRTSRIERGARTSSPWVTFLPCHFRQSHFNSCRMPLSVLKANVLQVEYAFENCLPKDRVCCACASVNWQ